MHAQMIERSAGDEDAAKVIKDVTVSQTSATKCRKILTSTETTT